MSKLRALELAVGLFTGRSDMQPSAVLEQAKLYYDFIGDTQGVPETATQVIGGVTGKPARTRNTVAKERETEAPAANESAVSQEEVNKAAAEARQRADAAVAAAKATTAARVAAEANVAATVAASSSVNEADIKTIVGKLAVNAAAGGAPKVREILGTFKQVDGVKPTINISTLQPKDYAAAKKAIEEVLEAAELAA